MAANVMAANVMAANVMAANVMTANVMTATAMTANVMAATAMADNVMAAQLIHYFTTNNLFCIQQFSLRPGPSTELASLKLANYLIAEMDNCKFQ